ncbi:MAG TPA: hypothetical protein VKP58_08065 [Candidatus Acidoferrum sp.]|nr:hypothetical protein [Candidatus Acidoferrum sp.]
MSTDPHKTGNGNLPEHGDVSFEARDISISSVGWSLVYLALTVIVSLILCVYFFKFTTQYVASKEKPRPMIRQQMSAEDEKSMSMPIEPRLQGVPGHEADAQQDMRDKIASDTAANESYGWVDEKAGIARIPVREAMKMIAEKGLPPVTPAAAEKKPEKKP